MVFFKSPLLFKMPCPAFKTDGTSPLFSRHLPGFLAAADGAPAELLLGIAKMGSKLKTALQQPAGRVPSFGYPASSFGHKCVWFWKTAAGNEKSSLVSRCSISKCCQQHSFNKTAKAFYFTKAKPKKECCASSNRLSQSHGWVKPRETVAALAGERSLLSLLEDSWKREVSVGSGNHRSQKTKNWGHKTSK